MPLEVLAIVNPVSGRRNLADALRNVVSHVREAGCSMTVRLTRSGGDAARLAADAPDDTRAILVVGGDGTVREIIDGLLAAGRTVPLAVMRTGTENLVAKELDQPTDPRGIARTLLEGRRLHCDVGTVNGCHFLLVAGIGFDAEVVRRLDERRGGHISHLDYFWPICRTFATHRFPTLRIAADGEEVFAGPGLAFVGVMARYSVGLRILECARLDDGMLDLCIYPCQSRARLLRHALATVRRRHHLGEDVIYRKCQRIRIEGARGVPLEIDGDPGGSLPADCSVLCSAATFLMPSAPETGAAAGSG